MNVVSLFSGIGGLDEGLRRAGFRHLLMCESDPYRRTVLAARFPGVSVADDVRGVCSGDDGSWPAGWGTGRRALGADGCGAAADGSLVRAAPSLVCGGFPCQDLSVAGQRRGLSGDRSGLFFEYARVAEALRPGWLLVENVPGLLSSNGGRDFGVVLGTLADIGYGLAWRILDSRYFGVPQRRRRVFIVGALADGDPRAAAERAGQVLAVGTRCPGHPTTRGEARSDVTSPLRASSGRSSGNSYDADASLVASLSGLGTGGPDDNDAQGNRVIAFAGHDEGEAQLVATSITLASDPISAHELAQPSTKRNGDPGVVQYGASVRRLLPVECERLQALPDGWTRLDESTPDSRRYAALGDAVTASVAEWIGLRLMEAA